MKIVITAEFFPRNEADRMYGPHGVFNALYDLGLDNIEISTEEDK